MPKGLEGIAQPATPESIAALHPLWAADMDAWGPWHEEGGMLLAAGRPAGFGATICGQASSSLDAAWALDRDCRVRSWSSVLCTSQTSGRGQLRREWLSPPGNIYAAWAWPDMGPLGDIASLLAGALLSEAFREMDLPVEMKWPNDLLLRDRKIGGILVEERSGKIMVGVGINAAWAPDPGAMRDGHAVAAANLDEDVVSGPLSLWLRLAESGRKRYFSCYAGLQPADAVRKLEHLLAWRGMSVRVRDGEEVSSGILVGLADDGALRLVGAGGEHLLYSGSILPY